MSKEGTGKFTDRVQNVIETSRKCNEITYSEILGVLEMLKFDILQEIKDEETE